MAVTVAGKNLTVLSSCDTATSGGTWLIVTTVDADTKKEGAASLSGIVKTSGNNIVTFTPATSKDLSGTKHVRFWILLTQGGLLNTYAGDGLNFWASDGTNTGYWRVAGKDNYPGGWLNCVIDVSKACDSGTKPTNMNAITSMGIRINLTGAGKNAVNTWIDNLIICDGLVAYGDDAGGYFDLDDIFLADDATTGGWGILRKIGGQYFATGNLEIGLASGTAATKFNAKSQVLVFENRRVNDALYAINVVDNGTGTTEFILGSKSGSSGIEGCMLRTQDATQTCKYTIDGATDTDVDNFKLYGTTFYDAGAITMAAAGASVETLNCNFEAGANVIVGTSKVQYCNFVSSDAGAVKISSTSHNVTDCNFIGCSRGVLIDTVGTYTFNNLKFSGCAYDVENTAGTGITVEKTNGSNPSTYTGSTVTFTGAVQLTMTVKDEDNAVIVGAFAYIDDNNQTPFIMNTTTNGSGVATVSYTGSPVTEATWRVRKYGYKNFKQLIDITGDNFSLPVTMVADPQAQ